MRRCCWNQLPTWIPAVCASCAAIPPRLLIVIVGLLFGHAQLIPDTVNGSEEDRNERVNDHGITRQENIQKTLPPRPIVSRHVQ